ncbi:MAG: winged helix-turn-helix domain-containing protein [Candidatus Aenigmatarchaeota archaeon]
MEKRYRSRFEIIARILKITSKPVPKIQIMYRANLSNSTLKKYLKIVLEHGLVEQNCDRYKITERGKEFLEIYSQLMEILYSNR